MCGATWQFLRPDSGRHQEVGMSNIREQGESKFPHLFSPIKIGPVEVPNRIFFPPWAFNWANEDGTISPELRDIYHTLAEAGNGIIYTGCANVSEDSVMYQYAMRIHDPKIVPDYKKLSRAIEERGAVPAIQLMNYGRQSVTIFTGKEVYAPSAVPDPLISQIDPNYSVRAMTEDDLERVQNDFVRSALLAAEAGFKIIQLHAAHGYLLSSFLSPYTNHRTDRYGGSPENRARYIVEIIERIKKELRDSVALDIRVSGDELLGEGKGLHPDDFRTITPLFEKAGVDMINVSISINESALNVFGDKTLPDANFSKVAANIKKQTKLPVGHAGWIKSLATGEKLISEGNLDLVGYGRSQFADNDFIAKSVGVNKKAIRKCVWDGKCLFDHYTPGLGKTFCTVNPKYRRPKLPDS